MPLPPNYSLPKGQLNDAPKKLYDPLPIDTYQVEIIDVTPAIETFRKTGEEKAVLKFTTVVLDPDYEFTGDENGEQKARGRRVWHQVSEIPLYPPKQGGKATGLYSFVCAVLGRNLNREECRNFSPEQLLNRQVKLTVVQNVSQTNGKTYNKVTGVMPIRKAMTPFDPEEFKAEQEAAQASKNL